MLAFDDVAAMRHPESGAAPTEMRSRMWEDQASAYEVSFKADTELMPVETITLSAVTGTPVSGNPVFEPALTNRTFEAIAPDTPDTISPPAE